MCKRLTMFSIIDMVNINIPISDIRGFYIVTGNFLNFSNCKNSIAPFVNIIHDNCRK